MRATLVGHACWVIEAGGVVVVTDPVLSDPFEEGTVQSCPSRTVDLGKFPTADAIYLSHRHLDHYHFESLVEFPRSTPIFCPNDPLLRHGLLALGFTDLRTLHGYEVQRIGQLKVLPIPSPSETFVEFGCVFYDNQSSILNQVDTPMNSETIDKIAEMIGKRIDVHLSMFASQNFFFFEGRQQDLAQVHGANLACALRVGARSVVPAAAGFRFVDELGWLNSHLFPISRQRFASDLKRLHPEQRVDLVNPGDTIDIQSQKIDVVIGQARYVCTDRDDTGKIDYDPTQPVPPLVDDNEGNHEDDFLKKFARVFVGQALPKIIQQAHAAGDELVVQYQAHQVAYRLEVVYPDGDQEGWTYRFGPKGFVFDRDQQQITVHKTIAASALADVCGGRRGCFWMRTRSRRSSAVMDITLTANGLEIETIDLRDLLSYFILLTKVYQKGEKSAQLEYYGLLPDASLRKGEGV